MKKLWFLLLSNDVAGLDAAELEIRSRFSNQSILHIVLRLRQLADRLAGDTLMIEADKLVQKYATAHRSE